MKKNLFVFIILLIISNCAGFEFAYNTNENTFLIKNNTNINVDGEDAHQIYSLLKTKIGDTKDNPKYKLLVKSLKTETASVINKDATASKFIIEFIINYDLYNLYKSCNVLNKEITTSSSYNSKSAGYSFGTSLSEKQSTTLNINKNINEFASFANMSANIDSCSE